MATWVATAATEATRVAMAATVAMAWQMVALAFRACVAMVSTADGAMDRINQMEAMDRIKEMELVCGRAIA